MAEITTTQSFSDGDTVTATKLNNIQGNASIQPEAITNRSAETSIDQANDLLLVYDASATALKKVSPSNLIKAGTASDFPITGNATIGGTLGVTGNSTLAGTLGVTGAITATSTINGTTIPTTKTLVTTVDTQTLTNKTFTTPVISSISNTGTLTLPTSTDTLVGRATTDTLTNKTLTSPSISDPSITGQTTASTGIINIGSGQIYKDASGNVGIGTASPTANLHVVKTTSQTDIDSATQAISITNTASDTSGNLTGIRLRQDNATNVAQGYIGLSSTGSLATRANLIIATPNTSGNSTERLRIDSSGNVGIGVTSPSRQLHVKSQALIDSNNDGTTAVPSLSIGALQTGFSYIATHNITAITNNTERLRIDSSGNVGIGTTSINARLVVSDGANGLEVAPNVSSSTVTQLTSYNRSTNAYTTFNIDALTTRFSISGTERLRIASAGQIGIGGANYGTSGQVLTSGGASAAPSWTTISSTPADGSITFAKLSTSSTEGENAAKRVAKVWVNYNGTTAGIRDDFNVSSITDNAEGDQTVNFSSSLSSASYCAVTTVQGPLEDLYSSMLTSVSAPATGSVRVRTGLRGVAFADCTTVNVCIFL